SAESRRMRGLGVHARGKRKHVKPALTKQRTAAPKRTGSTCNSPSPPGRPRGATRGRSAKLSTGNSPRVFQTRWWRRRLVLQASSKEILSGDVLDFASEKARRFGRETRWTGPN